MTTVLGISAFYHDSAAALVVDGRIAAAAQEERFSRIKNDARFPSAAIAYCLNEAGLSPGEIDYVAYYEKPLLKFDRILETWCGFAPRGFRPFRRGLPSWLRQKLRISREIRDALGGQYGRRVLFAEHHESHAASAFFPSPFEEAAILTVDGVGEWATATCGFGRGHRIELTHELHFPHSLGLLYSAFTHYCGFEVDAGEYKLMGLAPYGEPRFADLIREQLVDIKPDGSLRLDLSYFSYCHGLTMTSRRFDRLFGGPARRPGDAIEQRHMDIAASIQTVTEEILLRMVLYAHELTGARQICLAGGVALNCVANSRILEDGPFERIWIQPAAGDAGGSLGAALIVWHQLLGHARRPTPGDAQQGSLLGPRFTPDDVKACLSASGAVFHELPDEAAICERAARLIAEQKVIGWMQGRMEFGPRALGSRSILADARNPQMQRLLNEKIKKRESFRPFAPAVLETRSDEYFEMPRGQHSPYMLLVGHVAQSRRRECPGPVEVKGLQKLHVQRSEIPAVTHVDLSARVQSVDAQRFPRFVRLLEAFEKLTGCPLVINTSFNVKDEPIVCSPHDAWACFLSTDIDALIMETVILLKDEQPAQSRSARPRSHETPPSGWFGDDGVRLLEAARDPSPRQLLNFAWGLTGIAVVLLGIATLAGSRTGQVWWWTAAVAWGLSAASWSMERVRRAIYRVGMVAVAPLNWLIAELGLAIVYYGIVTPIGLSLRAAGRDPMSRRLDRSAATYWCHRPPPADQSRYLRPF